MSDYEHIDSHLQKHIYIAMTVCMCMHICVCVRVHLCVHVSFYAYCNINVSLQFLLLHWNHMKEIKEKKNWSVNCFLYFLHFSSVDFVGFWFWHCSGNNSGIGWVWRCFQCIPFLWAWICSYKFYGPLNKPHDYSGFYFSVAVVGVKVYQGF